MSGNLAYFVIREIIYAFLKRGQCLEENEIITYILAELKSSKIIDSMDKTNLDFAVVYCIFDLLSSLGFLTVRLEKGQKCLTWKGFPGFYDKNFTVFNKAAATIQTVASPKKSVAGKEPEQVPAIPNIYDAFTKAFFEKMHKKADNIVTYPEYQQISGQFLYSG